MTGRGDLGVKVRGAVGQPSRFETKYLTQVSELSDVTPTTVGVVEHWTKCSIATLDEALPIGRRWVEVGKARQFRRFAWSNGALTAPGPGAQVSVGCGIELTHLQVPEAPFQDNSAWTFAVEAWGPVGCLDDIVRAALATVSRDSGGLELKREWSMSYP